MNDKITMNKVNHELDGLVSVLSLILEAMDEDCAYDDPASAVLTAARFRDLYYPAVTHVFCALSNLRQRAKEAAEQ